jgi:general secretion pathway protein G
LTQRVVVQLLVGGVLVLFVVGLSGLGLTMYATNSMSKDAQRYQAALTMVTLAQRIEGHHLERGSYPASLAEVADGAADPWGHPFEYRTTASGFELRSLGADGVEGGTGQNEDLVHTAP